MTVYQVEPGSHEHDALTLLWDAPELLDEDVDDPGGMEVMHCCRHTRSSRCEDAEHPVVTRSTGCCSAVSFEASKIGKSRRITKQHLAEFIASLEDGAAWCQSSLRNSSGVMPMVARVPGKVPLGMSWPAWTGTATVRPSG